MKDIDSLELDVIKTLGRNTYTVYPFFDISYYKENKSKFYQEFGDNYWIEKKDVYVERSQDYLNDRYNAFIRRLKSSRFTKDLGTFIENNGIVGFYNNSVTIPEALIGDEQVKVRRGTKLSKVFKLFIKESEFLFDDSLEDVRNEYSAIIGQKSISGNLRISIHPYDYLTMSENNNGWRSCHSLDGEYSSGILSYMSDASTLVAYLYTEDNTYLRKMSEDIPWNSKKWRALIYINKERNLAVVSKHYPFHFDAIEEQVLELLQTIYPGEWSIKTETRNIVKSFLFDYGALHFNDVLKSKQYKDISVFVNKNTDLYVSEIVVGGKVMCIECGKNEVNIQGNFCCLDCCEYSLCDRCGEIIYEHNTFVPENGEFVCENCYNSIMEEEDFDINCDICGQIFEQENVDFITIHEGRFTVACDNCAAHIRATEQNE